MCLFSAPFLNAALEKEKKDLKRKKEKRLTTAKSQTDERFKYTVILKLPQFCLKYGQVYFEEEASIFNKILFL